MSKKCLICSEPTSGSIGAAGIKWDNICQKCKDKEDKALHDALKAQEFILKELDLLINRT